MPIRGLFMRANNVPKRILGCRLIKQSALRGFAAKAKDKIVKKGPIHKGNGIYTPHREKLFKLQNGYYILFLHKQAVSIKAHLNQSQYLLILHSSSLSSGTQFPYSTCDFWCLSPFLPWPSRKTHSTGTTLSCCQ